MNKRIKEIVDKALGGGLLTGPELKELLAVDYLSEESFYIQYASRKMSIESTQGKGEIHGQVGLNVGLCPKNCQFCSFAATNKVFDQPSECSLEEVIKRSLDFEENGANAVYLMATATYKFEDFLKVGKEVRKALKTDIPLIANVGDFDYEGAKALVESGFTGIYHAVRLGEGVITRIDPKTRLETVKNAHKVGLVIGTCLEPVGPEHTLDELVEKTLITRDMKPGYSGAGRRITIPGSPLEKYGMRNYADMAHVLAAVRLAMGYDVIGNCTHEPNLLGPMAGATLLWAESGSNPRDTKEDTTRSLSVENLREMYLESGWEVLEGPSAMYAAK